MHGGYRRSKKPIDWIPFIRDFLCDALRLKGDLVCFVPGKGIHSENQFFPLVRPIVLLISNRLGFDCFIDRHNKGVVIADVSTYHYIEVNEIKLEDKIKEEEITKDEITDDDSNIENSEFEIEEKNGLPRFLPSIEVNLVNVGFEKAKRALTRIFDGLKNGVFAEFVLQSRPRFWLLSTCSNL